MEFNFSPSRLLLLAILLGGFALWGGFSKPELSTGSRYDTARVNRAWIYCIALVVVGAAAVSIVDHYTGIMEPVNLRLLYILLGIGLMAAGILWLRAMKQAVEQPAVAMLIPV